MYGPSKDDVAARRRRAHLLAVQAEPNSTLDAPVPTDPKTPPNWPAPKTWSDRLLGTLSYIIPLSRIPDEQFLADLRKRKVEVDQELEAVQKQLELVQSHAGKRETKTPVVGYDSRK
jgi:hypothetical protein